MMRRRRCHPGETTGIEVNDRARINLDAMDNYAQRSQRRLPTGRQRPLVASARDFTTTADQVGLYAYSPARVKTETRGRSRKAPNLGPPRLVAVTIGRPRRSSNVCEYCPPEQAANYEAQTSLAPATYERRSGGGCQSLA